MRIVRIYTGQSLSCNTSVELEPGPSQHIARALRMQPGDTLTLFNGDGAEYSATISALNKKTAVVAVDDSCDVDIESPLRLELGIAISRGDRMDWVIQKATELGVASITPLESARTEVKLKGDRRAKKLQHWQQVIISACEQCGRNRLPGLAPLTDIEHWLPGVRADRKFVLHHRDTGAQRKAGKPQSLALLIGPEGGLNAQEIESAEKSGFEALSLGPRVLRTETAPLAALAILQARWGDMPLEL